MRGVISLSQLLKEAQGNDWAVPHFNVSTADQIKAIIEECTQMKSPVIIGVSEGEADFWGYKQISSLVSAWKEETGLPIYLNADHHKSLESVEKAVKAGFDSIHIDGSLKPDNENMAETLAVVQYVKDKNKNINIEGEIGQLPTQSSEVLDSRVDIAESSLTKVDQAKHFVNATGVDRLAPAVGNLHGIEPDGVNPPLYIERLEEIVAVVGVPLTLHGGSGLSDGELEKARPYVSNIHISTTLRLSYTKAVRDKIKDTTTPYKYLNSGADAMRKDVLHFITLFKSAGKADLV